MGDKIYMLDYRDDAFDKFHDGEKIWAKAKGLLKGVQTSGGESWRQGIELASTAIIKLQESKEDFQKFIQMLNKKIGESENTGYERRLNEAISDLETINDMIMTVGANREAFIKKYNKAFPDKAMPIPERVAGGKYSKSRKHKRRSRKTRRS